MAKSSRSTVKARPGEIVVLNQSAPMTRTRHARRSAPKPKTKHRRHSKSGGGSLKNRMMGAGAGGFGVGFIEKNFGDKLPNLPVIGKKGAIALGIAVFAKSPTGIIADIGLAAAAISGYELGKEGKITGHGGGMATHL